MKKFLFGLVALCPFFSYAQTDRIPGYIVTREKDSIRGFIIDRKDNWSTSSIDFARSEDGSTETIPIEKLNMFFLKTYDSYYFSRMVDLDKKPVDMAQLEDVPERKIVNERVLLKLIATGKLKLFNYSDENKKMHYFLQNEEGKIEELAYVKYMAANGRLAEMPYYKSTLQQLAKDCSKAKPEGVVLQEKPLMRFVSKYNSCFSELNYVIKKTKSKLAFGINAGFFSAQSSYSGGSNNFSFSQNLKGSYGTVSGLIAGISLELHSSRASNPSRPGIQLIYQNIPASARAASGSTSDEYKMSFSVIHIGPSYKYMFTTGKKINPFLQAQIHATMLLNSEARRKHTDVFGDVTNTEFTKFKTFNYSYAIGAGVSFYNRVTLEARYHGVAIAATAGGAANTNGPEGVLTFFLTK